MSDVEEIKRRLNIVDVVGDYVKLQKTGANFRARCPFHAEKTPSFFVSPERQIWHCFGSCGIGGDIFRFLMEVEGIEFRQALEILAKRAGVPLRKFDPAVDTKKTTLLRINEEAASFFQRALLTTKGGEKALQYMEKRGITKASHDTFQLGYGPSSWRALNVFLQKHGFLPADILESGLAIKNDRGELYDRFRARLMFPIFSLTGQVVGFSARALGENIKEAKYVNTPQTLIYDKSRELYGLYQAKSALKEKDEAIVMEGNIDVVLSHQAGVARAVAPCGTALTPRHLEAIAHYTKNIVLSFDNDDAGQKASFRSFEFAQAKGFNVYTLVFTEAKDPADVVLQQGSEAWQKQAEEKKHFMEFLWDVLSRQYDFSTIEGKKAVVEKLFHFLRFVDHEIERMHWISEFSKRIGVREETMVKEFQKIEIIDKRDANLYYGMDSPASREELLKKVKKDRMFQDKENIAALTISYPELALDADKDFLKMIREEVAQVVTNEELALKGEIFWPSEYSARQELRRILSHLAFLEKKRGMIDTARGED